MKKLSRNIRNRRKYFYIYVLFLGWLINFYYICIVITNTIKNTEPCLKYVFTASQNLPCSIARIANRKAP